MIVLEYIVVGFFAVWVSFTLLNQAEATKRIVRLPLAYDVFGLVPIWTFFAPNPGNTDTHVLYRDRAEGRIGPWKETPRSHREHLLALWQPKRRIDKAIVDVVPDLLRLAAGGNETRRLVSKGYVLSFPYLLLLNHVCRQPRDRFAEQRQFALARTAGVKTLSHPNILLVSAFHDLEAEAANPDNSAAPPATRELTAAADA